VPGSPLAQSGQHGFGHVDDAEEVGVDLSAEVFEGDVFDGGDIGVAGVVDHDVVVPERIEALLHHAVDLLGVGDVECDRPHVLAVALHEAVEVGSPAGGGDDLVAVGQCRLGDRAAQAA